LVFVKTLGIANMSNLMSKMLTFLNNNKYNTINIQFNTYSIEQLERIINIKLLESDKLKYFDQKSINFISKKVFESGDIRIIFSNLS
jgi:Cdc6-like AAA superfamily ATPase